MDVVGGIVSFEDGVALPDTRSGAVGAKVDAEGRGEVAGARCESGSGRNGVVEESCSFLIVCEPSVEELAVDSSPVPFSVDRERSLDGIVGEAEGELPSPLTSVDPPEDSFLCADVLVDILVPSSLICRFPTPA